MIYAHEPVYRLLSWDGTDAEAFCETCGEANPPICDECHACICETEECESVHYENCSSRQYMP